MSVLAAVAATAVLSQTVPQSTVNIQNQHTRFELSGLYSTTVQGQFYLGMGRYVKVNEISIGTSPNGCTVQSSSVHVAYARPAERGLECNTTQCESGELLEWDSEVQRTLLLSGWCVVGKYGQPERAAPAFDRFTTCEAIATPGLFAFPDLQPTSANRLNPAYFKAHGGDEQKFFMEYEFVVTCPAGSSAGLELSWNARVKDPSDLHCVTETDASQVMLSQDDLQFDHPEASLPRHHQHQFKKTMFDLPAPVANPDTSNENDHLMYFDLGTAPILQLGCLNVFVTAETNTSCPAVMQGTDLLGGANTAVSLMEHLDCNAYTDASEGEELLLEFGEDELDRRAFSSCCSKKSASSCNSVLRPSIRSTTPSRRACFWVPQTETCYPSWGSRSIDVSHSVGLTDTNSYYAPSSHLPRSSFYTDAGMVSAGYSGGDRRWHLLVQNNAPCVVHTTVSYISSTTGGWCEPSTRAMCDAAEEACLTLTVPNVAETLLYWNPVKASEGQDQAREVVGESKFTACNCLKQREICYRKNGCYSTKRYQNIVQNCLQEGCGDFCNSSASVVANLALVAVLMLLTLAF